MQCAANLTTVGIDILISKSLVRSKHKKKKNPKTAMQNILEMTQLLLRKFARLCMRRLQMQPSGRTDWERIVGTSFPDFLLDAAILVFSAK